MGVGVAGRAPADVLGPGRKGNRAQPPRDLVHDGFDVDLVVP